MSEFRFYHFCNFFGHVICLKEIRVHLPLCGLQSECLHKMLAPHMSFHVWANVHLDSASWPSALINDPYMFSLEKEEKRGMSFGSYFETWSTPSTLFKKSLKNIFNIINQIINLIPMTTRIMALGHSKVFHSNILFKKYLKTTEYFLSWFMVANLVGCTLDS